MASASLTSLRLAERRQGPVELRRAAAPLLYFAAVLQNLAHLVAQTYGPLAIRHGCAWVATRGSSKYPEQVGPVIDSPNPVSAAPRRSLRPIITPQTTPRPRSGPMNAADPVRLVRPSGRVEGERTSGMTREQAVSIDGMWQDWYALKRT